MGVSAYRVVGDEAGDIYPVVHGRLRRHPGLGVSEFVREICQLLEEMSILHFWLVEPEESRSFRE